MSHIVSEVSKPSSQRPIHGGSVAISAMSKLTGLGSHKLFCGYQSIKLLPCWQVRQSCDRTVSFALAKVHETCCSI